MPKMGTGFTIKCMLEFVLHAGDTFPLRHDPDSTTLLWFSGFHEKIQR